jgi:hypothetical protein
MKWDSFAYGGAIGVAVALTSTLGSAIFLNVLHGAKSWGPSNLGIAIFGLNIFRCFCCLGGCECLALSSVLGAGRVCSRFRHNSRRLMGSPLTASHAAPSYGNFAVPLIWVNE